MQENVQEDVINTTLTGQARELALAVGGRLAVEVWAWCTLNPAEQPGMTCLVHIGREIKGSGKTTTEAVASALRVWKAAGSVTDPADFARRDLEAKAAAMGLKLVPAETKATTSAKEETA